MKVCVINTIIGILVLKTRVKRRLKNISVKNIRVNNISVKHFVLKHGSLTIHTFFLRPTERRN